MDENSLITKKSKLASRKYSILLFMALIVLSIILAFKYLSNINGPTDLTEPKVTKENILPEDYENSRLKEKHLIENKISRDIIFTEARENCMSFDNVEYNFPEVPKFFLEARDIIAIENRIEEPYTGVYFINEEIPNSIDCYATWMVDVYGVGVVGYYKNDGTFVFFDAQYPSELIAKMLQVNVLNNEDIIESSQIPF